MMNNTTGQEAALTRREFVGQQPAQPVKFVRRDLDKKPSRVFAMPEDWQFDRLFGILRCSQFDQRYGSTEGRQRTSMERFVARAWGDAAVERIEYKPDWGRSAWNPEVNNFREDAACGALLAEVKRGAFKGKRVLLMWDDVSRFCRQGVYIGDAELMAILLAGVYVYFCSTGMFLTPQDINDPVKRGRIFHELDTAQRESDTKSRNVKASYDDRIEDAMNGKGHQNWGGAGPRWIKHVATSKSAGRNGWREPFHRIVERIARAVLARRPASELADVLNVEGVPSLKRGPRWKGQHWNYASIRKLLRSEALVGTMVFRWRDDEGTVVQEIRIPDAFPAILKPAEFEALQAIFADKRPRGGGHGKSDKVWHLFPGGYRKTDGARVFCAKCGCPMFLRRSVSAPESSRAFLCGGYQDHKTVTGEYCEEQPAFYSAVLEQDLFTLVLTKSPAEIVCDGDKLHAAEVIRLKVEVAALKEDHLCADRSYKAFKTEEAFADAKRAFDRWQAAQARLTELMQAKRLDARVEGALAAVVAKLRAGLRTPDAVLGADAINAQLADQAYRRGLIEPLKQLVLRIEMESTRKSKRYRVQFTGGGWSEWRDVTLLHAAHLKEVKAAGWTPEKREAARLKVLGTKRGPMSAETKAKISDARKGKPLSAEARANMSAAAKARWAKAGAKAQAAEVTRAGWANNRDARRAAISRAMTGKKRGPMSAETKAKIAAALRARKAQ